MPQHIVNRAALRRALLEEAASTRHHKFTRVSPEIYPQADRVVRRFVQRTVASQPSAGKTVQLNISLG